MARPRVLRCSPARVASGSEMRVFGGGLNGGSVRVGRRAAQVVEGNDEYLLCVVPAGLTTGAKASVSVSTVFGQAGLKDAVEIAGAGEPGLGEVTLSAPVNYLLVPSKLNQKYLVLMVLPSDQSFPDGKTVESLHTDLVTKLSGPGLCANGFWTEASYGKTSLLFDVPQEATGLAGKWDEIFFRGGMMVQGTGVSYPVTWSGGETLELGRDNGFSVTVSFSAGTQSLDAVRTTILTAINDRVKAINWTGSTFWVERFLHQLRLVSPDPGSQSQITVGGTAAPMLGLDNPVITPGGPAIDAEVEVLKEAVESYLADKTDSEVQALFAGSDSYQGVFIVFVGDDTHYRTKAGTYDQTIRGLSVNLSAVWTDWTCVWWTYAHEIGHNLGRLPDLYFNLEGVEVGPWDIMGTGAGSHPTAWTKAWCLNVPTDPDPGWHSPWIPAADVLVVDPPQPGAVNTKQALLVPTSCMMPPPGAFEASYPGVPLVHAIRFDPDSNHSYYVEAREKGPFQHPDLGSAKYDSSIPASGVIVTDALNNRFLAPVNLERENVLLVTPMTEPLRAPGDECTAALQGACAIKVKCLEVLAGGPSVYLVEVSWGPGLPFDLRIDPWPAPPYESTDIWVDSIVDNGWDEYSHSDTAANPHVAGHPVGNGDRVRVGDPCRVYARVWNDGSRAAKDVQVDFTIVVPPGSGPDQVIGTASIAEIPPGWFGLAHVDWTPQAAAEGHACIRAIIKPQSDEAHSDNNMAQENVTDWYLEGGSAFTPVEFAYQVQNPLPHRARIHLRVRGLTPGYHVSVGADAADFWLEPGEIKRGVACLWAGQHVTHMAAARRAPTVSLEWLVERGCYWAPFAGISGRAHAVRKSNLAVTWGPRPTAHVPREILIHAAARTPSGPAARAHVRVRILDRSGETVLIARGETDASGNATIPVKLPSAHSVAHEYQAEVLLSPTTETGPAEDRVSVRFHD